jgi:hypothetical protein
MAAQKPPLLLLIGGWIAIIVVPTAFFIFGWRDIELTCRRPSPGAPPTCQVSEAFAMGLYTRQVTAAQATGVSFQIRPSGGGSTTSTVILATSSGAVPISKVASNVDGDAKQELIQKMQGFLDAPDSLEFHHHARMHSLFGYLGVAGVAGLAVLLLSVAWYQLRSKLGRAKSFFRSLS